MHGVALHHTALKSSLPPTVAILLGLELVSLSQKLSQGVKVAKKPSSEKYLKLRGNVWWFSRGVPKELQESYSTARIERKLDTSDIQVAKARRDQIVADLSLQAVQPRIRQLKEFRKHLRDIEPQRDRHGIFEHNIDLKELIASNQPVLHDVLKAQHDTSVYGKYEVTLKDAVDLWIARNEARIVDTDTIKRVRGSAKKFCDFLSTNAATLKLKDIQRYDAHNYMLEQEQHFAKTTIQGEYSRLKGVWNEAKNNGFIDGDNPFVGHVPISAKVSSKYQLFDNDELQDVLKLTAQESKPMRLVTKMALFTGARQSEICNLKVENFVKVEGCYVLYITSGKNDAAVRTIALSDKLSSEVKDIAQGRSGDERLFGIESDTVSRRFSALKSKVVTDGSKVFHSFRVHYATAAQRSGVNEYITAELIGHSVAKSMSYGYYSKGHDVAQLKEGFELIEEYILNTWWSSQI